MDDHVETLRRYNRWRRGTEYNGKFEEMPDPRVIGEAIDAACDEVERMRAELAAIRELMNCYNLGGWTDSLALIKERDEAIAELAECKSLLTHAGLIAAQEQHTALRTELAACMVLLDQAYKALKYHREQTRPIHETDEAIAAIDKARKGEEE